MAPGECEAAVGGRERGEGSSGQGADIPTPQSKEGLLYVLRTTRTEQHISRLQTSSWYTALHRRGHLEPLMPHDNNETM